MVAKHQQQDATLDSKENAVSRLTLFSTIFNRIYRAKGISLHLQKVGEGMLVHVSSDMPRHDNRYYTYDGDFRLKIEKPFVKYKGKAKKLKTSE